MRKKLLFYLPIVIITIMLTACKTIKEAVTAKTPDLNKAFSCEFTLTAFGEDKAAKMEVGGTMRRLGTGMWEMDITAPETMAGLHISFGDNGLTASLGELTLDIERENINEAAMFRLMFDAVDNCAAMPDLTLAKTENGLEYSGEISQCGYVMTFDPETMALTGISFPDADISTSISSFTELTGNDSTEGMETRTSETETSE